VEESDCAIPVAEAKRREWAPAPTIESRTPPDTFSSRKERGTRKRERTSPSHSGWSGKVSPPLPWLSQRFLVPPSSLADASIRQEGGTGDVRALPLGRTAHRRELSQRAVGSCAGSWSNTITPARIKVWADRPWSNGGRGILKRPRR